jgi:hypothetical protein
MAEAAGASAVVIVFVSATTEAATGAVDGVGVDVDGAAALVAAFFFGMFGTSRSELGLITIIDINESLTQNYR